MAPRSHKVRPVMNNRSRLQRGYSLIEMLVVVAIVAIVTLVTVPNFMAMRNAIKVKASMREFMNSVRWAQRVAVSEQGQMRIVWYNVKVMNDPERWQGHYDLTRRRAGAVAFTRLESPYRPFRQLQGDIRFVPANGTITLASNGTLLNADGTPATNPVVLTVLTDRKTSKPSYTITLETSGVIRVE